MRNVKTCGSPLNEGQANQPPVVAVAQNIQPTRSWQGNSDFIACIWLLGSLFCVVMACLMSVGEHRRVYLPGSSLPLPELCSTYGLLGIDCPGCGLTRTFIHMAHGQLSDAWSISPVGMLVFLFACLQIPMGISQVVFRQRNRWIEAWGSWNDWCTAGLLIALLVQWGINRCP